MNKLMYTLILGIFLLSLTSVTALDSLGTFKQNTDVRVAQVCSDATFINISSIAYPNGSVAVSNIEMTSAGSGEYYYLFDDTSQLGRYDVRGISDGCENTFATYFIITESGNDNPEGLVIVVYSILFFALLAWMLFTLFWNIAMLAELKTDIKDVMFSMLGYFGIIAYYYFAQMYFAKELVLDFSLWMIQIGGFTHVFLPLVGFVLFMTIGRFKQ